MLREHCLEYLRTQYVRVGETVQCGWFVFKAVEGPQGLDLVTLDFKTIASFTDDFQIAEHIHWAQQETLRRLDAIAQGCTLLSQSYHPRADNTYIERLEPLFDGDSGWYVGTINELPDEKSSFVQQSLYELTIHDDRLARFWLLPVGYRIYFDRAEPRIQSPA